MYNGDAISKSRNTHFGLFRRQSPLEEIGRGLKQPAFQSKLTAIQQNRTIKITTSLNTVLASYYS